MTLAPTAPGVPLVVRTAAPSPASRTRTALYLLLPVDPAKAKVAIHRLRAFAKAEGFAFIALYAERPEDSVSRRKLRQLVARARVKGLDAVCVLRVNDLAGTPQKVGQLVAELGVPLLSAGGVRLAPGDPLVRWLEAAGRRPVARRKRTLAGKRARGECVGGIPFGYRRAADGVHVEADAEEQAIVSRVWELHAQGHSDRSIARLLDAEGVTSRAQTPLSNMTVGRILRRKG